ncbi:MAG: imidazole glycerol phosphate synthase subunit HisH [Sphingopyxis sp.]|nr:imidazole glycerol phosphate synthase subunit HisH [Sphingopyxis sp.]
MAQSLALIDYGAGNLRSVANALAAAGAGNVAVTNDPAVVAAADRIVLPGVGAFRHCMHSLAAIDDMVDTLTMRVVGGGVPFLGICVGMQLMAGEGREHGVTPGLGWIDGWVDAIVPAPGLRIPHMGWNDVSPQSDHPVMTDGEAYFLHSYHFHATDHAHILATTDHGGPVVAAVGRDNMLGVQFHPEKSQAYGLALLNRFMAWRP